MLVCGATVAVKEIKKFLSKREATFLNHYALMKFQIDDQDHYQDDQVKGAYSHPKNEVFQVMLFQKLPDAEKIFGVRLLPTYCYFRIYEPGDELHIHTDRASCEYSLTVNLGYHYTDVPDNYRWLVKGLIDGKPVAFEQEPGDAMAYLGCEVPHWRNKMLGGENSYHAQVFMHYVNRDTPMYEHAHDQNAHLRRMWEAWVHMRSEGILV